MLARTTLLLALSCAMLGCAGTPRFMRRAAPASSTPLDPGAAKVVLIWNAQPCETGGAYVIVDDAHRFLANLSKGTRAEVLLKPGEHLIIAWNPERERGRGIQAREDIAVLPATLAPGYVYFVQLRFRPEDVSRTGFASGHHAGRACGYRFMALTPIRPGTPQWNELGGWMRDTIPVQAIESEGQAFLDENPEPVQEHFEIARARLRWMKRSELDQSTIAPGDGTTHGTAP